MSGLLSLPTELLEAIIEITIPCGGFESLLTTCKTVYEIGSAHIERYNNLRREWRCTRPAFGKDNFTTSLNIIEAIVQDPDIAWFIEDLDLNDALDLNDDKGRWDNDNDTFEPWLPDSWAIENEVTRDRARQLVMQSPILASAAEHPEDWLIAVHAVDEHGEPFATQPTFSRAMRRQRVYLRSEELYYWRTSRCLFLLTLLPNLKHLRLPNAWGAIKERSAPKSLMSLLDHMVRQAREQENKSGLPLSQLRQLLPFQEVCSQPAVRSSFEVVAPFTILPTLTEMHISNSITVNDEETLAGRVTDETGIPFLWPYGEVASNLRTIKLEGSAVNGAAIAELLAHTPHVTTFEHTHDDKYRGCQYGWDARTFVSAIGEHLGPTLKTLRIGFHGWGLPSASSKILSLSEFTALESVKLHVSLIGAALPDLLPRNIKCVIINSDTEDLVDWCNSGPITNVILERLDRLRDQAQFPELEQAILNVCVHNFYGPCFDDWKAPEGVSMPLLIEGPLDPLSPGRHRSLYRVHFLVKDGKETTVPTSTWQDLEKLLKDVRTSTDHEEVDN